MTSSRLSEGDRKIAEAVLGIYNQDKSTENFFKALEETWENLQTKEDFTNFENFKKVIIPECHKIQPPTPGKTTERKTLDTSMSRHMRKYFKSLGGGDENLGKEFDYLYRLG